MQIEIDKGSNTPAYRQVYLHFRKLISSGELKAGDKLPKIRELSSNIKVARNTIEAAYRQLAIEGYAKGKRGVGYIVENIDFTPAARNGNIPDLSRFANAPITGTRNPLGDSLNCDFDFSYGNRDPSMLPLQALRNCIDSVLSKDRLDGAAKYIDPKGLPELRMRIAEHLAKTRDVFCDPEQIVLQPGTQTALRAISSLFGRAKQKVAIENPGYTAARVVFEESGHDVIPIPVYRGFDTFMNVLEESEAQYVFLTPSNQFPLGFTMPIATRLKTIEWAKANDSYIIEDDYCCEYRYGSSAIPSVHSLAPECVIYMGTFSKILSPSIRITYMVLPPKLLEIWEKQYKYVFCPLPWLDQAMVAQFMGSPDWSKYVRQTITMYTKRHDALLDSINKYLPEEVDVMGSEAGLHILLGDRQKRSQTKLINLAVEKSVRVYETDSYWMGKSRPFSNYVLVGFSSIELEKIPEGIKRLAQAWR